MNLNISGFFNVFKLLTKPSLCLPHATVSQFNELPFPLEEAFDGQSKPVQIKAVILDKDDCFAYPETNLVHPPYTVSYWPLQVAFLGGISCRFEGHYKRYRILTIIL